VGIEVSEISIEIQIGILRKTNDSDGTSAPAEGLGVRVSGLIQIINLNQPKESISAYRKNGRVFRENFSEREGNESFDNDVVWRCLCGVSPLLSNREKEPSQELVVLGIER